MKKISYAVEAFCLYLIFGFLGMLPATWASGLGGFIGRHVGKRLATSRKALDHIARAFPDRNNSAHRKILVDMWDNLGRTLAEYPHLKTIATHHVQIENLDILDAYPRDQNFLFFSAHLANWEICAPSIFLARQIELNLVYRAPNNPWVNRLLDRYRRAVLNILTIPKSKKGARDIVRVLADKKHLGILIDQKYNEGIAVPFFGHPAMTSPAFVQLAQKFEVPLIPAQVIRVSGCSFRMIFHPPLPTAGRDVQAVISEAHTMLETWITDHPGQWLWLHRRWDSGALKGL